MSSQEQFFVSYRATAKKFSLSCLCTSTTTPKKRGLGKKLLLAVRATMQEEHVDLVAGDFNGAAWRQSKGNNIQPTSILEDAFADTDFPMPPGPTPLWSPGAVSGERTDVCVCLCQAPELVRHVEGSFAPSLHNSSGNPRRSSERSKLPPRSVATLGPCQQSICS